MKSKFEILKLDNEPYDFLVIATSYENPLSSIDEIKKQIKMEQVKLLFDLTLINGVKKNRYIRCEYVIGREHLPLCSIVDGIDETIKKISYKFFMENDEIVQNSVIPNSLKFLLKENMI